MSDSRILRYGRWTILLLTVACLLHAVATTSLYLISPTELGLVSRLPITFWIGLAFLGCLWFSCAKGPLKYQVLALVLTVSYVYVAPAVIRTPVWVSESYYPYGESLLINSQGHLVYRDNAPLVSYQDWPLFLYLASSFKLVTGLADTFIMKFFPLLTISMYAVVTFLVLRIKLKSSFAVFGAAFLLSSYFTRQQYFGPQGIAYIFFLLAILVISRLFFEENTKKRTLAGLYVFLFMVLMLTHALTAFMTAIVVAALYLYLRIFHKKQSVIAARLVLFSVSFFLAYNMFIAPGFFSLSVERLSEFILDIWQSGISRELSRIPGSSAQTMSYVTSWSIVFLAGFIAVAQTLYAIRNIRSNKQTEREEFSIFPAVWLGLVVLFGVTTVYGSNEAYQRAFMFGLIPLAYLSVRLLSKKPRILVLVLCGLLFLNIPAQYGSDTYRLATNAVLTGTSFFVKSISQNATVLYGFYPHVRYFDPLKNVVFEAIPGTLPFTSVPNSTTVERTMFRAEYTIRSDLQHNYYMYFLRQDPFELVESGIFNRLYDDRGFRLFKPANAT